MHAVFSCPDQQQFTLEVISFSLKSIRFVSVLTIAYCHLHAGLNANINERGNQQEGPLGFDHSWEAQRFISMFMQ
jgi:hypothetical protein